MQDEHGNIPLFLTLILLLSVPFWILDTIYPIELLPGLPLSALGVVLPTLAAYILIYRKEHLAGVLQLLRRAFDLNRLQNKNWLFVAILINPLIAVSAFGIMRAVGIAIPNPTMLPATVLILFMVFFVSALAEEIGWTGYATEPLKKRWGILIASIILGIVWSVWHSIPLLHVQRSLGWIVWWSLWTISSRLIIGWLYIHSGGSVFVAVLFHTMINLCWQLFPINGSFFDPKIFGLLTFGVAIIAFLIEQLGRKGSLQVIQS